MQFPLRQPRLYDLRKFFLCVRNRWRRKLWSSLVWEQPVLYDCQRCYKKYGVGEVSLGESRPLFLVWLTAA